jgi:CBS domain-containing protein
MYIVRQILESKGYDVWSVAPDITIYEALQLMAERDVGAMLVMEEGELIGIFSERDYARKVALEGKSSRETPVRDGMTSRVFYVRPDDTVEGCMALMTDRRIRHLPVLEDERVVGVISIGDVVKGMISQQANTIYYLESYITNGHPEIARKVESRAEE